MYIREYEYFIIFKNQALLHLNQIVNSSRLFSDVLNDE